MHFYLNKRYINFKVQVSKLNYFFYFVIISIISPPVFFTLSNKLVSIYQFLDILLFIIILYLMLSLSFIVCEVFKVKRKLKEFNFVKLILIILIFIINFHIDKININKNKNKINELLNVQNFIKDNNLTDSKKKLFTNDKDIMLLWMLNDNTQLTVTWGFVNSLKNEQIEYVYSLYYLIL